MSEILDGSVRGREILDGRITLGSADGDLPGKHQRSNLNSQDVIVDGVLYRPTIIDGTPELAIVERWGNNTIDDYASCDESFVYMLNADTAYDGTNPLQLGRGSASNRVARSIVKFAINTNISGKTILEARIFLKNNDDDGAGTHNISVYRCLQNWVEAQVTWNSFSTGNSWNTAGFAAVDDGEDDDSATADRHSTALDTVACTINNAWYSWGITSLAQSWADGTVNEYGVCLVSDNEGTNNEFIMFNDSEYSGFSPDGGRPYLEVTYVE